MCVCVAKLTKKQKTQSLTNFRILLKLILVNQPEVIEANTDAN